MVPFVVMLTMGGGAMVTLVVTLTGNGGVARVRADGRVSKKARRVFRVTFIVAVLIVVRLLEVMKNGEIYLWVGVKYKDEVC